MVSFMVITLSAPKRKHKLRSCRNIYISVDSDAPQKNVMQANDVELQILVFARHNTSNNLLCALERS